MRDVYKRHVGKNMHDTTKRGATLDMCHANTLWGYLKISRGTMHGYECKNENSTVSDLLSSTYSYNFI